MPFTLRDDVAKVGVVHGDKSPLQETFWQVLPQNTRQYIRGVAFAAQRHGQRDFAAGIICLVVENELTLARKLTREPLGGMNVELFDLEHP